jgi:hypothetical protein
MVIALTTSCAKNEYENKLARHGSINTLDSLTGQGGWIGRLRDQGEGESSTTSCASLWHQAVDRNYGNEK